MSFKRIVKRDKQFEYTHHPVQQKSEFQKNFNFSWIPVHYKSFIMIVVIFIFSQFFCVPFFAQFYNYPSSLILTHGIITNLLIILSFQTIAKEKAPLSALFIRFCFLAIVCGGLAFIATLFIK